MAIEITVPRLGWSMEEGIFSTWLKKEGESVRAGEPLFAMESDKVTMDVESLDDGILHLSADAPQPGVVVTVGQRIGYLLAEGESAENIGTPEPKAQAVVATPAAEAVHPGEPAADKVDSAPVTPRARR